MAGVSAAAQARRPASPELFRQPLGEKPAETPPSDGPTMLTRCVSLLCSLLFHIAAASAHQMPKSTVLLDFHKNDVIAELRLPLGRLEVPLHHRLESLRSIDGTGAGSVEDRRLVAAYVLSHLHAAAPNGRPWSMNIVSISMLDTQFPIQSGAREVVVRLNLRPPRAAQVGRFDLFYDVITRELVTHSGLMTVRSDWRSGVVPGRPELVGAFSHARTTFTIDRSAASDRHGLRSLFDLGMRHIAEGTDHLLFLLTLLLPAPLTALAGRWSDRGAGLQPAALRIAGIVSAFTVGHSLTLLACAPGFVRVPSTPVEILIAISILVTAAHAIRPIFPGREPVVAACFGLIHGMAFATVIGELGLDGWAMALGIAAFNIGIEVMQLIVVAAAMPSLALLARTRFYRPVRVSGAVIAAVAAVAWIGERALGLPHPVEPIVDAIAAHGIGAACVLASVCVLAALADRRQSLRWAAVPNTALLRTRIAKSAFFRARSSVASPPC